MRSRWMLLLVFSLLFSGTAYAAGMAVHTEVSTRVASFFDDEDYPEYRQYIVDHPEAYQAGSPFPDWGYQFGYPDESEEAHWPPFMEAFAQYIHDNYPKPWDEETIKMVVFYLGVVSHNSADVDIHSGDGTIGLLSHLEFHDDFGAAHNVVDGAGEFYESYDRDMDWVEWSWYWPFADIAEVYHIRGFESVTAEILEPRTLVFMLGTIAIRLGGHLIYPVCASWSPFLVEEQLDLFYGGLDGMAIRTMWSWQQYIEYVENGVPDEGADEPSSVMHGYDAQQAAAIELGWALWRDGLIEIESERGARGVTYHARAPRWLLNESSAKGATKDNEPSTLIAGDRDYLHFGHSLAVGDYNHDGERDLAVGAPGYGVVGAPQLGAVYVYYGRSEWSDELSPADADVALLGEETHGRLGWALATVDVNADGIDDLAVGSPATQADVRQYKGRVEVFAGSSEGLTSASLLTVEGEHKFANAGHSLAGGDLNGDGFADLVVGAPHSWNDGNHRGLVGVFYAGSTDGGKVGVTAADVVLAGANAYDMHGYNVAVLIDGSERLLLVSAPGVNSDDTQEIGALVAYDFAGDDPTAPVFTLTGVGEFDKFGLQVVAGDFAQDGRTLLAIAAPSLTDGNAKYAGGVYVVDRDELSGAQTIDEVNVATVLRGAAKWERFGWRLAAGDPTGDGAPDLLVAQSRHDNGKERVAGAAYLFAGGDDFLAADQTEANADWAAYGPERFGLLGQALLLTDIDGDGRDDIILAANRDYHGGREAGAVRIYLAQDPVIDALTPDAAEPGVSVTFTIAGALFIADGLQVSLRQGEDVLTPDEIVSVEKDAIEFSLTLPAEASGEYDLHVATVFGEGTLAGALTVGTADDDTTDDDAVDDDSVDDDMTDDDAVDDDAADDDATDDDDASSDDDDDNDDGCGC
ncbi:MAG TPA: FG-GAP-like repeat-containing protein [bacterium]|nr:FG-GAP-like repeat-containing protein [bacterium]